MQPNNPTMLEPHREAMAAVDRLDRALQPKMGSGQAGLFDADAFLPLGEDARVQMGKATQQQVVRWWAVQSSEHAASVSAYSQKATEYADWMQRWQPHHKNLGQVVG